MAKLKLTQINSKNGQQKGQIATLRCLGIRKMHQTVEVEKTATTMGQVAKVAHLLKIEEID